MQAHEVRKATAADIDALAGSLARAFEDDPLTEFIFPARNRLQRLQRFFVSDLRAVYLRHDDIWTTTDLAGAALWAPPDKWRRSAWEVIRTAPATTRALGNRVAAALGALSVIERNHPPGPHYYLGGLGTDPSSQGKGVGSAVIAPVLARCDEQGIGAYLESSKEKNLAFYNRHGFEVTRELRIPRGGPPIWLMWREPR
jgi:ribosomal protein S18 acetylase RimI-like enzyme